MRKVTDVEELREIQLDILKHVDSFCKQNNIKYFLCGGSMIGAVRHHGFIPWDDDIDIMMLRDDYEKFIMLYNQIDSTDYLLHHYTKERNISFPYVKIGNSNTVFHESVEIKTEDLGISIDLFPIDVVPENKLKQRIMYGLAFLYMSLMNLKNVVPSSKRSCYKNLILIIGHFLLFPLPLRVLIRCLDDNAKRYIGVCSKYCGIAVWGYGMREINLRSNWNDAIDVPFESLKFPIPEGYDNYLSCVYGNYMQLPPIEDQVSHHSFEAWWK